MYEFSLKKANPALKELGIHTDNHRFDYKEVANHLNLCRASADEEGFYETIRWMSEQDLFFLCYFVLDLPVNDPFLIARIYEVQNLHHFTVDLWSREHFKSSILSFALTIWQLIHNPEERICIFSHTRVMAKNHLRRIKQTLEQNVLLHKAFPDIFFSNPQKDSPKWSEDEGIYVKRKKNFAEASIEAWGLIDSSPIGKHYSTLVYDDLVTEKSVTSAEQIRKATEAFKLSQNLGTRTGTKRVIGTRYSAKDPYGEILKSKKWKPRIYPAEVDEEGLRKRGGTPVYLTMDELNEKYDTQGEYIYCLTGDNRILIGNYRVTPIEDIKVGDEVIGMLQGGLKKKASLVKTDVIRKWHHRLPCVELTLANGQKIKCTKEHKWWTGRWPTEKEPNRKAYAPISDDGNGLHHLRQALDFTAIDKSLSREEENAYHYLAGMFDADGSVSSNTITITQSTGKNRPVCDRIEKTLETLGIDYGIYVKGRAKDHHDDINLYYLKGGRQLAFEFLNRSNPAKGWRIERDLLHYASRLNSRGGASKVKVTNIRDIGCQDVYAIETGTGNYIAEGFISSNSSQMLQDPVAASLQGFKEYWLKYWKKERPYMNYYIVIDPATTKKKDSDYTVMAVIGTDSLRNYWLVDMVRDRLGLGERWEKLKELILSWDIKDVGYEQSGLLSDVEYMNQMMEEHGIYFNIIELKARSAKTDRIKRLVPLFQSGRFIIPRTLLYEDVQGETHDLTEEFVSEEYLAFPYSAHDDMLDAMARILDSEMGVTFPTRATYERVTWDGNDPLNQRAQPAGSWMAV